MSQQQLHLVNYFIYKDIYIQHALITNTVGQNLCINQIILVQGNYLVGGHLMSFGELRKESCTHHSALPQLGPSQAVQCRDPLHPPLYTAS